jgi:hypothetical protein
MRITIRQLWQTLFIVVILMFIIGVATDSTDVSNYQHRMERYMAEGNYEKALEVGEEADATDAKLTQLRIEALRKTNQLGDRLFTYPVVGSSKEMRNLKGDDELCAYLMDRQLDQFAETLSQYYEINDKLPRHYQEALTLYNHKRANPRIVFHNTVMETDYKDLQELEKKYINKRERKLNVMCHYRGTYWYYFDYQK